MRIFRKVPKDPPVMQGMHYYGGSVTSDPREKAKGWPAAFDASHDEVFEAIRLSMMRIMARRTNAATVVV